MLVLEGVTTDEMRAVTAACSQNRKGFSSYNHSAMPGVEAWIPMVRCSGPDLFTVTVPHCDLQAARAILQAVAPGPLTTEG